MAKLLVLDIDGTLLNSEDIVTPVVKRAIAAVHDAGVHVALATGRRVGTTRRVVEEIGIRLPIITFNGALVWDTETERPLRSLPFSHSVLARIVDDCARHELAPVLLQSPEHGEHIYTSSKSGALPSYLDWFLEPRRKDVKDVDMEELKTIQGVLTVDIFGPERALRDVWADFAELEIQVYDVGEVSTQTNPPNWALNVHMPGASKAAGVEVLAARLGYTMQDVVAVGDGNNDLPLLEAAGIGVAMGNATDEVKARADAVVVGHDEDGVAEAIDRYVLQPIRAAR
jgi:5-amino-6-(5-phospho-D-ribitylamino)uracil phosphatase